jgi:hypothetical protein
VCVRANFAAGHARETFAGESRTAGHGSVYTREPINSLGQAQARALVGQMHV